MRKIYLGTATAVLALVATSQATTAFAQDSGPNGAQGDAPADDIVVTGSRITGNMASSSPLMSVEPAQLQQTGAVTLDEMVNRLPQVVPARGATSNDGLTGGITTLDLRGLGSNRTLILQDSRRLPAATPLGSVDINIIPAALIESVDVVTGGASAAYGSDAIAGVVNFKLNHRFSGLQLDLQSGITDRGDGFTGRAAITGGTSFADGRGHAILSAGYDYRRGIPNSARSFSRIVRPSSSLTTGAYIANAANLPSQAAVNALFGSYGAPADAVAAARNLGFNSDGSLFSFQTNAFNFRDQGTGLINSGSNVRYNSSGVAGLTIPFERYSLYGRSEFELSDGLSFYAEGNYQHSASSGYYAPGFTTVSVSVDNPFISEDLAAILASRPDPTANFNVTRRFAEVGNRIKKSNVNAYQLRLGAKGDLGISDWTWDLYGSYARTDMKQTSLNSISKMALTELVSAADSGASRCAGGLNLFGLQANTACADYIRRSSREDSRSRQGMIEATIQGTLLTLPAGAVKFAAGADYRSDKFSYEPDAALQSGDIISFTSGALPPVAGSVKAKEIYAELAIPLLADMPFAQALDLNLGYRYSDYERFGGVSSYRAEASWEPVKGVRLRGGYARAVRAPSIDEAFAPTSSTYPEIGLAGAPGQGDPCDVNGAYRAGPDAGAVQRLCLAQGMPAGIIDSYVFSTAQIIDGGVTGGNINLDPEVADTYTIGATINPRFGTPWLSDFSLSVDYYNISIDGAIGTIDAGSAIQKCYNFDGSNPDYSPDNYYCGLFGRNASTGEITGLQLYNLNLGKIKTSGIDVTLDWLADLEAANFPGGGRLRINGALTWLDSYRVQTLPGEAYVEFGGTIGYADATGVKALPRWKALAGATYTNGPVSFGMQYRYVGGMLDAAFIGADEATSLRVPAKHYLDLNASFEVGEALQFRLGVNNLTDTKPATFASFDQSNTLPGVYDVFGRSYYAGVTIKW